MALGRCQSRFDEEIARDGKPKHDEGEDAAAPGEANTREQLAQEDREDDTTDTAGCGGNTGGKTSTAVEEMRDGTIGG